MPKQYEPFVRRPNDFRSVKAEWIVGRWRTGRFNPFIQVSKSTSINSVLRAYRTSLKPPQVHVTKHTAVPELPSEDLQMPDIEGHLSEIDNLKSKMKSIKNNKNEVLEDLKQERTTAKDTKQLQKKVMKELRDDEDELKLEQLAKSKLNAELGQINIDLKETAKRLKELDIKMQTLNPAETTSKIYDLEKKLKSAPKKSKPKLVEQISLLKKQERWFEEIAEFKQE